MRDFKRALARLLPCCSSSHAPRRPSPPLSLSLRNSGDPQLPSETPSLVSDPPQPPATATDAVNLLEAEQAGIDLPLLLPNQVDTLDDWYRTIRTGWEDTWRIIIDLSTKNVLKHNVLKKINGTSVRIFLWTVFREAVRLKQIQLSSCFIHYHNNQNNRCIRQTRAKGISLIPHTMSSGLSVDLHVLIKQQTTLNEEGNGIYKSQSSLSQQALKKA